MDEPNDSLEKAPLLNIISKDDRFEYMYLVERELRLQAEAQKALNDLDSARKARTLAAARLHEKYRIAEGDDFDTTTGVIIRKPQPASN